MAERLLWRRGFGGRDFNGASWEWKLRRIFLLASHTYLSTDPQNKFSLPFLFLHIKRTAHCINLYSGKFM